MDGCVEIQKVYELMYYIHSYIIYSAHMPIAQAIKKNK